MTAAIHESDPGRLLRPFVLTACCTDDTVPVLDLASMVVAVRDPEGEDETSPEQAAVLRLCAAPCSIAEIAAALAIPPSLTRLLVSGMVAEGSLRVGAPPDANPTASVLYAVLEGLRAL
ncbi:DUF742 domain-containing protein [Thermobifida cellulosilytica]|mgnify:CR=1 FL=1|uniref:DUF742 domain-containing protein n=1 Tax=Thermobifida cellulosilytica TB100 TaxID=665004 RepID=A0A147KHZ4_THECS|nr:DUF742 domain-containing protein [Thermobifida cellulosilytica]KUP96906.1 hypothetical protein AC529_09715 [Thermobifida cellulosilytica TB100]